MTFTIKIYQNSKIIKKVLTHKRNRFWRITRTINWENSMFTVYVAINYEKFLDNHGKYTMFYNDGEYTNREDFLLAINAFLEK